MYAYGNHFFATADRSAAESAEVIIGLLTDQLPVGSVLDLGCGRGMWLAKWRARRAAEVIGVDGPYVEIERLHIPRSAFVPRDLSTTLSLGRRFDLVQSLEVAEHLPESAADQFVDNVVNHGDLVLFSAAIPGQGGERHVNEQPLDYWRNKFLARQYDAFDFLRPLIKEDRRVSFWYRQNILLYAHSSRAASLPAAVRASQIEAGAPIANYLNPWMKFRTMAVRALPRAAVDEIARIKYKMLDLTGYFRDSGK
jgi:SAM-dependent methyltransferase